MVVGKCSFLNFRLTIFLSRKNTAKLIPREKTSQIACGTFEPISVFLIAQFSALKKIISRTIICPFEKEKRKNWSTFRYSILFPRQYFLKVLGRRFSLQNWFTFTFSRLFYFNYRSFKVYRPKISLLNFEIFVPIFTSSNSLISMRTAAVREGQCHDLLSWEF